MDTLVKNRLTGAVILVALIVALVPELLSGPIRPAPRSHDPASPAEEPPLRSYTISLGDDAHGAGGSVQPQPQGSPSPLTAAAEPAAAEGAARPVAAPAEPTEPAATPSPPPPAPAHPAPALQPSAAPRPATTPAEAPATGAYLVQLGSFASRANAERLARQVHGQGLQVSVSRASRGRRLYRVQVGPARDHAAAEQLAAKLHGLAQGATVVPK